MPGRRLLAALAGVGCGVWYLTGGGRMAWLTLLWAGLLPWLSLAVSLGAMRSFRLSSAGPETLEMGQTASLLLMGSCCHPMPPFRGRIRLRACLTGKTHSYTGPRSLCTDHCGAVVITVEKARVCDYLGLFALPVKSVEPRILTIRPRPVPVETLPEPVAAGWQERNGALSEYHELRSFRAGDTLGSVHWKLSARQGSLLVRAPMEPRENTGLVTLELRGDPETLDRVLGRLLWVGRWLLDREAAFALRALTGEGTLCFFVSDRDALLKALDRLLRSAPAAEDAVPEDGPRAGWHYHIGGRP